jgi:hypothetical protein
VPIGKTSAKDKHIGPVDIGKRRQEGSRTVCGKEDSTSCYPHILVPSGSSSFRKHFCGPSVQQEVTSKLTTKFVIILHAPGALVKRQLPRERRSNWKDISPGVMFEPGRLMLAQVYGTESVNTI